MRVGYNGYNVSLLRCYLRLKPSVSVMFSLTEIKDKIKINTKNSFGLQSKHMKRFRGCIHATKI